MPPIKLSTYTPEDGRWEHGDRDWTRDERDGGEIFKQDYFPSASLSKNWTLFSELLL